MGGLASCPDTPLLRGSALEPTVVVLDESLLLGKEVSARPSLSGVPKRLCLKNFLRTLLPWSWHAEAEAVPVGAQIWEALLQSDLQSLALLLLSSWVPHCCPPEPWGRSGMKRRKGDWDSGAPTTSMEGMWESLEGVPGAWGRGFPGVPQHDPGHCPLLLSG